MNLGRRSLSQESDQAIGFGFPQPPQQPSYYFSISGVDFVSISDEEGNTNATIDDVFTENVANVTYDGMGENSIRISTPTTHTYTLTFHPGTSPLAVEILKGINNTSPTVAIRYQDLTLPSGVLAKVSLGPNGVDNLSYDSDGDGTFDTIVTPTASVIGSAATDVTAPRVTVTSAPQQVKVLVTIAAQDSESGVRAIYYSLDGSSYQPYTEPVLVNPAETSILYAFADDNTANRSATVAYSVPAVTLSAVGPAQVWIGLKNSDDVGTKFDLLAEIFKNGLLVGSGQVNDVVGGSSGFNNAKLDSINLALSEMPTFVPGDTLSIRLSVRIAASSGHRSGTARLWFNDASANSRFTANLGGMTNTFYLQSSSVLGTNVGPGPKNTIDVFVDRAVAGNPFKAFDAWTKTF
jgi:hypothetical protein